MAHLSERKCSPHSLWHNESGKGEGTTWVPLCRQRSGGEKKKKQTSSQDKEISVRKVGVLAPTALLYLSNEV